MLSASFYCRFVNIVDVAEANYDKIWSVLKDVKLLFIAYNDFSCLMDSTIADQNLKSLMLDRLEKEFNIDGYTESTYDLEFNKLDILKIAEEMYLYLLTCPPKNIFSLEITFEGGHIGKTCCFSI